MSRHIFHRPSTFFSTASQQPPWSRPATSSWGARVTRNTPVSTANSPTTLSFSWLSESSLGDELVEQELAHAVQAEQLWDVSRAVVPTRTSPQMAERSSPTTMGSSLGHSTAASNRTITHRFAEDRYPSLDPRRLLELQQSQPVHSSALYFA